jgi:tetratricopeptide (TPR) repeat protein
MIAQQSAITGPFLIKLVTAAFCLVLLSTWPVEAQEDVARFDVGSALAEGYDFLEERLFDKAKAVFEDVIVHEPKSRGALEGLVWVAFLSGRYEEAGRAADRLRILDPEDTGWTRKWIEVVWHDPARRGEALAEARSLLIKDEDDIETRLLLAELLSRDSQTWAEAATEYEKVLKKAPQNVQALTERANLAIWIGDLDHARRFLQLALAVDPTNTVIAEQIQRIESTAEQLSHSRIELIVPLALVLIFLSTGIGYSARELTLKAHLLLFLQIAVLMSLAALWVYVGPSPTPPNSM